MNDNPTRRLDVDLAGAADAAREVQQTVGNGWMCLDMGDMHEAKVAFAMAYRKLAALIAALAVLAGIGVGVAPQRAEAATYPLGQPVKVVLSGPSGTLTAKVVASAPTTAHGVGRWIAVSAPIGAGRTQVRVGTFSAPGTVVPVRVTLPARQFTLGRSVWMTRDLGDGKITPMVVDARQATRFTHRYVGASWPGTLAVLAQVTHYSSARGAWVPSQSSPVQVQALLGAQWVTVASLTTDAYGWVGGNVPAALGTDVYRLVRPDGATVWGADTGPLLTEATPLD